MIGSPTLLYMFVGLLFLIGLLRLGLLLAALSDLGMFEALGGVDCRVPFERC